VATRPAAGASLGGLTKAKPRPHHASAPAMDPGPTPSGSNADGPVDPYGEPSASLRPAGSP
jgi:hypothetical protein